MGTQNTDIVTTLQNNGKTLGQIQQTLVALETTANAINTSLGAIGTALAALFPTPLNGSASWTPGAVGSGASVTQTVSVAGAALGDYVQPSVSVDLQGQLLTGYVSAANTVTLVLFNPTGSPITLGTITARARTYAF